MPEVEAAVEAEKPAETPSAPAKPVSAIFGWCMPDAHVHEQCPVKFTSSQTGTEYYCSCPDH